MAIPKRVTKTARSRLVEGKRPVTRIQGFAQMAIVGDRHADLLAGVEETDPVRVDLIVPPHHLKRVPDLQAALDELGMDVHVHEIQGEILLGTITCVRDVMIEVEGIYDDVLMNLGGADRGMSCAGLSAAFVAGVKTFDVMGGKPVFLPVLRFSYSEVVSDAKMHILGALDGMGGECRRLRDLSKESELQDSLVSYHIRGGREGRGLEELGLVKVNRGTRGSLTITLTPMGRLLAQGLAT